MPPLRCTDFHGTVLRSLSFASGPWFLARDVATALGIGEHQLIAVLDPEEIADLSTGPIFYRPSRSGSLVLVSAQTLLVAVESLPGESARLFRRWLQSWC